MPPACVVISDRPLLYHTSSSFTTLAFSMDSDAQSASSVDTMSSLINASCFKNASCVTHPVHCTLPGGLPDITAYRSCKLSDLVEDLPAGFHVIGDNAYMASEHLLTPFCGADARISENDNFNFFLSQLRIRIEMTFGLLTTKWRILRNDQQGTQDTISKLIEACIRLHNFVIDTDGEFENKQPEEILSQIANVEMAGYNYTPLGYHHTVAMDDDGEINHELMNIPGVSIT